MVACLAIDQLCRDPDAAAGLADTTFEDVAHTKLPRDLFHIEHFAFVGKGGVPSDHRERRNLREVGDDVLANAVAEILLLRIAAHVHERQHANRKLARRSRWNGLASIRRQASCSCKKGKARLDLQPTL